MTIDDDDGANTLTRSPQREKVDDPPPAALVMTCDCGRVDLPDERVITLFAFGAVAVAAVVQASWYFNFDELPVVESFVPTTDGSMDAKIGVVRLAFKLA